MASFTVGTLIGSLARESINRKLARRRCDKGARPRCCFEIPRHAAAPGEAA